MFRTFFPVCFTTSSLTVSVLLPTTRPAHAAIIRGTALQLINGARAAAGVAPVQASAALAGPAGGSPYHGCGYPVAGRSADMGARNYFSNAILNCNDQGASHRLQAAGVTYSAMAENIALVRSVPTARLPPPSSCTTRKCRTRSTKATS